MTKNIILIIIGGIVVVAIVAAIMRYTAVPSVDTSDQDCPTLCQASCNELPGTEQAQCFEECSVFCREG